MDLLHLTKESAKKHLKILRLVLAEIENERFKFRYDIAVIDRRKFLVRTTWGYCSAGPGSKVHDLKTYDGQSSLLEACENSIATQARCVADNGRKIVKLSEFQPYLNILRLLKSNNIV